MPVITGAAADGTAAAINVTGDSAPLDATREFVPGYGPRVHRVTVATPLSFVVITVAGRTVPLPIDTVKRIALPRTGFWYTSRTRTPGGMATAVPTNAVWPSPLIFTIRDAAPAVPIAVKVVTSDPLVARRVFVPACVPILQLPTVATPFALVTAAGPFTIPPPPVTVKVTRTPLTGAPSSVIRTLRDTGNAVPTVTDCPFPAFTDMVLTAETGVTSTSARKSSAARIITFCFVI